MMEWNTADHWLSETIRTVFRLAACNLFWSRFLSPCWQAATYRASRTLSFHNPLLFLCLCHSEDEITVIFYDNQLRLPPTLRVCCLQGKTKLRKVPGTKSERSCTQKCRVVGEAARRVSVNYLLEMLLCTLENNINLSTRAQPNGETPQVAQMTADIDVCRGH